MTVREMAELLELRPLATPEDDREISGVYIGDLLSWVMGRARSGDVWITIMSNINIVAVASLADVSCITLAEGVVPDEATVGTAAERGINLYTSPLTAYRLAARIASLLQ